MAKGKLTYTPVEGKTYTLFGNFDTTGPYFDTVRALADRILEREKDISVVLKTIESHSARKKNLRKILRRPAEESLISYILHLIHPQLLPFTGKTQQHLDSLPLKKLWDRRLGTTREQYHLYMLEIELTNRINAQNFRKCDRKIALTPYCLQDFFVKCKAEKRGEDVQCMHCSANCFQNYGSALLEQNGIEPYIWMGLDIRKLALKTHDKSLRLGILGIACIPELVHGMRKCRKLGVPSIGLPLNANRCIRWFGDFKKNSIDLRELESLVVA